MRLLALGVVGLILFSSAAFAVPASEQEKVDAQNEIHDRVTAAVDAYARRISMVSYEAYCQLEMERQTVLFPTNGYIPFGVNYKAPMEKRSLRILVEERVAYESSAQILCLANAKNALRAAEH